MGSKTRLARGGKEKGGIVFFFFAIIAFRFFG